MGKCESSKASIGIKILLSDLILQINETNFNIIQEILWDDYSLISDENENFNDIYSYIISSGKLPKDYLNFKNYLEYEFKKGGLFDKELLLPIKRILTTDRWGYDREGRNGNYCPIDFDLSIDIEKYKEIEKITIVFILEQNSG
jgi:hypothetical protein